MEHLQGVMETGEATEDTYKEKEWGFIKWAPKYDGNTVLLNRSSIWEIWNRSVLYRNDEKILTTKI